ncbi:MAG: type I methionyl aminopeptidase [bacterium]|nr:type I methionyl aminopeptidase [bacterium]
MPVYNEHQLKFIRQSCDILHDVEYHLMKIIREGITTREIDRVAEKMIRERDAVPAFLGVKGDPDYPATCCISINEEVVHGIPGDRKLKNGDLVSIDCGAKYKGYYSDAAFSFGVGNVSGTVKKLLKATRDGNWAGAKHAVAGNRIGDISAAIQRTAEKDGFNVVRHLYGHGVGAHLHEDPAIFNYGSPGTGIKIEPGMVLAIETMVCEKGYLIETLDDNWTVVSSDGGLAAHYEDEYLVTENGPPINLTRINIEGTPILIV